jgi:hypothetical protein
VLKIAGGIAETWGWCGGAYASQQREAMIRSAGKQRGDRSARGNDGVSLRCLAALAASAALVLLVAAPAAAALSARAPAHAGHDGSGSGDHPAGDGADPGRHHDGVHHHHDDDGQPPSQQGSGSTPPTTVPPTTVPTLPVTLPTLPPLLPPAAPVTAAAVTPSGAFATSARSVTAGPAAGGTPPAVFTPAPPTPSQILPLPTPGKGGVARALQTAQSYVLLLALCGVVVLFLAAQGHLDRRDPRIVRAPVRDHLEFQDFE